LAGNSLSSVFDAVATLSTIREGLQERVHELGSLKNNLQTNKSTAEEKRQELAKLQQNLAQQNKSLAIARQSQSDLLAQTKNKESTYQAQIAQKKAQEEKFEQDLLNYEAQLNLKVTPGSLPPVGSAPLSWPLDSVRITQYFGNTPFSTANPQIYNGHGHSGVDLAASPGTPIKAARGGTILGTGNTDVTCPGASYGKWVFIKHDDGLSTLYAHLSTFAVSKGQTVTRGQVIGYSGTTGYATGPHLHFAVFASSGSEIASFASKSCAGKTYTMPVGDLSAYLNPLSYLPAR
jgi:murein DD-endopeptidase MepM/ murein hydrolase activator NlpD